jgi:hypothetical protein
MWFSLLIRGRKITPSHRRRVQQSFWDMNLRLMVVLLATFSMRWKKPSTATVDWHPSHSFAVQETSSMMATFDFHISSLPSLMVFVLPTSILLLQFSITAMALFVSEAKIGGYRIAAAVDHPRYLLFCGR